MFPVFLALCIASAMSQRMMRTFSDDPIDVIIQPIGEIPIPVEQPPPEPETRSPFLLFLAFSRGFSDGLEALLFLWVIMTIARQLGFLNNLLLKIKMLVTLALYYAISPVVLFIKFLSPALFTRAFNSFTSLGLVSNLFVEYVEDRREERREAILEFRTREPGPTSVAMDITSSSSSEDEIRVRRRRSGGSGANAEKHNKAIVPENMVGAVDGNVNPQTITNVKLPASNLDITKTSTDAVICNTGKKDCVATSLSSKKKRMSGRHGVTSFA
jgi:hypothetical protein